MVPHDLVVGGSGMLAGLCRRLAGSGRQVTVIARDAERLGRLAAFSRRIHPFSIDYRDRASFPAALDTIVEARGPIDRGIVWVQDGGTAHVVPDVAARVRGSVWQILGGSGADPARAGQSDSWRGRLENNREDFEYRQIILGFAPEDARWLRENQISSGVERALATDASLTVIGSVVPWSDQSRAGRQSAIA